MLNNKRLFTSESVTEGHLDKIADQVSDAILDAILKTLNARVACETTIYNRYGIDRQRNFYNNIC